MIIFSDGLPQENLRDIKRFRKYVEGKCLAVQVFHTPEMLGMLKSFSSAQKNKGRI